MGENGKGRDYSAQFSGAKADGIPIGKYLAQVRAEGRAITSDVVVYRTNTLIVLSGLNEIIERGPGQPGVSGKVAGVEAAKLVWIRMVRVFSEDLCCTIVPLSVDGTFSFGGLDAGDYVLLVLADSKVLFEGRVRIDGPNMFITVDLGKSQATAQPL